MIINILSLALMFFGIFSIISGIIGVFKFDDFYNKLHAASIIDSFGIVLCLIGLILQVDDRTSQFKLGFLIIFIWILSPMVTNILAFKKSQNSENLL